MTYGLDLTEEFKGVKYYGREVGVLQGGKVEVLVMFEETLGDVLSPYCSGLKDSDPDYELAISIDDGIFCYVPTEVLQHDDEYVCKWCDKHDIDVYF